MRDLSSGDRRVYLAYEGRRVDCLRCQAVKNEGLEWLADNPLYTKRFAYYVGRRCRATTVRELAEELLLDWHTVKELDKQYMREQLRRVGIKSTKAIGIDEISVGPGHDYRIVVSDLIRGRPIWFGGIDRSEKSLDDFFAWFGPENCRKIRFAVMDMWKPFRASTLKNGNAPRAKIVYDKFHVLRHLGQAMDQVRRAEYARLEGKARRFIKGQRFNLLTRWANLAIEGRRALKVLFQANKRLAIAYLLQDSFDQLWSYETAGWARRFFDEWCDSLKWQRLKPFEKFAAMIDAHWDGVASYCLVEVRVHGPGLRGLSVWGTGWQQ